MKLTIESTGQLVNLAPFSGTTHGPTLARVWRGTSEGGAGCLVLVAALVGVADQDRPEFERDCAETLPPGRVVALAQAAAESRDAPLLAAAAKKRTAGAGRSGAG